MKDSAVRNPSAAHRPQQKRKRVRRRRIFRAVARYTLSVTEAGPLFPDFFFGVDTPLSSSPRGLLSPSERSPRGELHKGRFQLQGKTRNVQGGHDGKFGNGNHHSDEDRLNFWLRHVDMTKMLSFERHVFCWMKRLCPHYDGGFWEFYDLSNGGFYIALAGEKKMWLTWPGNYFNDEMSADAPE